jgi:hypothetical protein
MDFTGGFKMKRNIENLRLFSKVLMVFLGAAGGFSATVSGRPQQPDPPMVTQDRVDNQVFIQEGNIALQGPPVEIGFQTFSAIVPGKVVKGAPYSAVATTEMNQPLSDGNQISHKATSSIYRDSQGRTRREESFSGIGMLAINGKPAHGVVFISDPVSGAEYILEPENKIARKMPSLPADGVATSKVFGMAGMGTAVHISGRPGVRGSTEAGAEATAEPGLQISTESRFQTSSESLGQQTIEGVVAEGKRRTTTIPAGVMGNQRPITTISEEWFSPELQMIVSSTTKDPRMGETTYRLTNIQRTEPSATLFTLPPDYTVKEFDKPEFLPRPPQSNE